MSEFQLLRIPIPIQKTNCQICGKKVIDNAWVMVMLFPEAIIAEDLPLVCSECKLEIQDEASLPHPATLKFPREMPSREEAILAALHRQDADSVKDLRAEVISFSPNEDISTPSEVVRIKYPKVPKQRSRLKQIRSRKKDLANKSTSIPDESDK